MPTIEQVLDPLERRRADIENSFKIIEKKANLAKEKLALYQGAIEFFELGLKLGREKPEQAEALVKEIQERLTKREQDLGEQLHPARRR